MANGEESQSSWSARQGGVTGLLAGITRGLDTRLHTDMNKVNQTPKSNGTIPVAEWS